MNNNAMDEITKHIEESIKKIEPEQSSDEIFESLDANLKKLAEDVNKINTTLRNILKVLKYDKKH